MGGSGRNISEIRVVELMVYHGNHFQDNIRLVNFKGKRLGKDMALNDLDNGLKWSKEII